MSETTLQLPQEETAHSLIESSVDFEVMKNPYDRMEYVYLTDTLIHRLEGHDKEPKPDIVLFLDKSARPVSWLTSELWDTLAREPGTKYEEGIVPKKPSFIYLNIDSKNNFGPEDIPGLRSLFTREVVDSLDGVEDEPTFFEGKNILVVDEIGVSLATLVKAKAYMEVAFPEASISGYTWMDQSSVTNYGGQGRPPTFNKETFELESDVEPGVRAANLTNNLRWYKDRSDKPGLSLEEKRLYDDGRGIIDRDAATEEELKGLDRPRTRLGQQWLSAVPKTPMRESVIVRREMKMIAQELKDGILPYWPANGRDDVSERCELFNGIDIANFAQFREWFKRTWWKEWADAPVIIKRNAPVAKEYESIKSKPEKVVAFAIKHALFKLD